MGHDKTPRNATPRKVTAIEESVFERDSRHGWTLLQFQQDFEAPDILLSRLEDARSRLRIRGNLWKRAMDRKFYRVRSETDSLTRVQVLMKEIRRLLHSASSTNLNMNLQRKYQSLDIFNKQRVRLKPFRKGVQKFGLRKFSRFHAWRLARRHGHLIEVAESLNRKWSFSEVEFLSALRDEMNLRGIQDSRWGRICHHGLVAKSCSVCSNAPLAERDYVDEDGLSFTSVLTQNVIKKKRSLLSRLFKTEERRHEQWKENLQKRTTVEMSVPEHVVEMFANALRDHRRPCEPQRFWSESLSKRWFGSSDSTDLNEMMDPLLGSLCSGELRILSEDVVECKKRKNGVASLIVLVEVSIVI